MSLFRFFGAKNNERSLCALLAAVHSYSEYSREVCHVHSILAVVQSMLTVVVHIVLRGVYLYHICLPGQCRGKPTEAMCVICSVCVCCSTR